MRFAASDWLGSRQQIRLTSVAAIAGCLCGLRLDHGNSEAMGWDVRRDQACQKSGVGNVDSSRDREFGNIASGV